MSFLVADMVGSPSDLTQCLAGLRYQQLLVNRKEIEFAGFYVNSIHRNTRKVLANVRKLSRAGVKALNVGAGWANHLTGTVEAYLRYTLMNMDMQVFGIAFEDEANSTHTQAAILSITEVPGTQVIYCGVGSDGFMSACVRSAECNHPAIKLPNPRPTQFMRLKAAIAAASKRYP